MLQNVGDPSKCITVSTSVICYYGGGTFLTHEVGSCTSGNTAVFRLESQRMATLNNQYGQYWCEQSVASGCGRDCAARGRAGVRLGRSRR